LDASDPKLIPPTGVPATDLHHCPDAATAFARISALYEEGLKRTEENFTAYAKGAPPAEGDEATYPYICLEVDAEYAAQTSSLVFGKIPSTSVHGSTVTAPALFEDYLLDQLAHCIDKLKARVFVGRSLTPIPLTFAMEKAATELSPKQRRDLQLHFHLPNLAATNDDIADGGSILRRDGPLPLALFAAERVDYSLHRLRHYTATSPEHFQRFVLFTNYQRYVDEFVEYGRAEVRARRYERFVEPGDRISEDGGEPAEPPLAKLPQMPAYHLVREGRTGITLVNIGVGPSNAKTATDHLAVLRPHVWLMVGHCGGLRRTQRLGDYVLAHAYLRDDKVLDASLPPAIPLPTIAEVQVAMTTAVGEITGQSGRELKEHLRTGTVVTTDDRNWELRFDALATRFNLSRAIAIDMESATIAANGYRFRVPYGTLLCVSDRPLHGEIKLPGMADAFYQERVSQHLTIGIRALELLREEATAGTLHSRKLRSFDEPVFR